MSDEKSPDEPEVRFTADGRVLHPEFVKRMGAYKFEPGNKSRLGLRKKPLTEAIETLVDDNPELANMMAVKLFRMALNGKGDIQAMKLLFDRLDGVVKAKKEKTEMQGMTVVLQQVSNSPRAPEQVASIVLPVVDPETPAESEAMLTAIRRASRHLPPVRDLLPPGPEDDIDIPR